MTTNDIIRMAREAGATNVDAADPQCWVGSFAFDVEELARFAALVAAAEREACAKECEAFGQTLEVDVGENFAEAIRARGGIDERTN